MANMKDDLDLYLLMQGEKKRRFGVKMPEMTVPDFGNIFSPSTDIEPEANRWLMDAPENWCPKLSRLQRIVGCITCLGLGVFFLTISTFYIPVLLFKARKFVVLYTLGSVFFILSFCFLSGFVTFIRHAFSKKRMIASGSYTLSMLATINCAIFAHSTALTVFFAVGQIIALFFMIMGTVPGGSNSNQCFGQLFKSSVSLGTLPV